MSGYLGMSPVEWLSIRRLANSIKAWGGAHQKYASWHVNLFLSTLALWTWFLSFTRPEHNHADSSCKWTARPKNGLNTISCSTGQCAVKKGSYSKHGSHRSTKCRKHFVLAKGFDMDICQDGSWTSSGHTCIRKWTPGNFSCSSEGIMLVN